MSVEPPPVNDGDPSLGEVLQRVAASDRAAFESLYERTCPKLFGICLRILQSRSEAEEVLQEIYVTIWRKAGSYDPARASPMTWLGTLARNRAIDRLRTLRSRSAEPIDAARHVADDATPADEQLAANRTAARLHQCLDELEEKQRGAIRAAFFGGFTYAQLADRACVPLGTMKSWVRRGLLKLKECVGHG